MCVCACVCMCRAGCDNLQSGRRGCWCVLLVHRSFKPCAWHPAVAVVVNATVAMVYSGCAPTVCRASTTAAPTVVGNVWPSNM